MSGRRHGLPIDEFRRARMLDILAVVPERNPASTHEVAAAAARDGVPLGRHGDHYTLSNEPPPARPWFLESALRLMQRAGYLTRTRDGAEHAWRRTKRGTEVLDANCPNRVTEGAPRGVV